MGACQSICQSSSEKDVLIQVEDVKLHKNTSASAWPPGGTLKSENAIADSEPAKTEPALPASMRAVYFETYGAAAFRADAPVPQETPAGMVLVRVKGASLNPVDNAIAGGFLKERGAFFCEKRSFGSDVAGVVVRVGEGATVVSGLDDAGEPVSRLAVVGDEVFGDCIQGFGTFAEFALVRSVQLVVKPPGLAFHEAASLPLAGLTAYQAMTKHCPIGPGSKVLVLGGSGGVGSLAIQIGKALGATVCGPRSLAATHTCVPPTSHSSLHPLLTAPLSHTTPHRTTQHPTPPHHTTPHHTTPHHTPPRRTTLNHNTPHNTKPLHSTPLHSTSHHTTPYHSTTRHHAAPH
jgi:hypothetical protein